MAIACQLYKVHAVALAHVGMGRRQQPHVLARARMEQIGEHWLLPILADVPLEKLGGGHCAAVFERIERINSEIAAQQGDGRAYVRVDGDVRSRPRPVGIASQHRVYAALREFCNFEVRKTAEARGKDGRGVDGCQGMAHASSVGLAAPFPVGGVETRASRACSRVRLAS